MKTKVWRRILPWWPLLLPLLFYAPSLLGYPYPSPDAKFSDIAITHLPNLIYLKEILVGERVIPLWSSLSFGGTPFAANPLSGLWYPPGWPALLLPPHLGFGILVMIHILWGGIGMVLLLKSEGLRDRACLLGALAFESMPKLIAHFGAGHLTLLYAVPWLPWLAWVSILPKSSNHRLRHTIGPGVILALIFLADPRWLFYAGLFWLGWVLVQRWQVKRDAPGLPALREEPGSRVHFLAWVGIQGALALGLSAILLIPMVEFTRSSRRFGLSGDESLVFSLPPGRILGLIFPDFGGNQEFLIYCGGMILLLSVLAIVWSPSRKRALFWGLAVFISLIFALGVYFPPYQWIAQLPPINLMRVPSRALFITGTAMAALSAFGLDRVLGGVDGSERRWARLILVGLAFFALGLGLLFIFATGKPSINWIWGSIAVGLSALYIFIGLSKTPGKLWFAGLLLLCLVDWMGINRTLLFAKAPIEVEEEGMNLAEFIIKEGRGMRVYSPSYSLPQQTSALYQIEHVDGVDPLYLERFARFMESATGVPDMGYSVSIPPFSGGDPEHDNAGYDPNPDLLGELNVGFILSAFDLDVENLELVRKIDGIRIYKNLAALPAAWIALDSESPFDDIRSAEIIERGANHRLVRARGPGLLVLSEIDYPGWSVKVDDVSTRGEPVDGLLQAVHLGPGNHLIDFQFRPVSFYLGLFITLATIVLVVCLRRVKFRI